LEELKKEHSRCIDIELDKDLYNREISLRGFKEKYRGNDMYTIVHYSDLDEVLGFKWIIQGLNKSGDFCCVLGYS